MNKKRVHTPEGVRDVYGTEYGDVYKRQDTECLRNPD